MGIYSYQAEADPGGGWRLVTDPPYLVCRGGTLLVELPGDCRGCVNGLPILGLQVVLPGDLVRVATGDDSEISYVVGRPQLSRERGENRVCDFTGLPIQGDAVRCACGAVYCPEVANQLDVCPRCAVTLHVDREPPPPEELL